MTFGPDTHSPEQKVLNYQILAEALTTLVFIIGICAFTAWQTSSMPERQRSLVLMAVAFGLIAVWRMLASLLNLPTRREAKLNDCRTGK